MKLFYFAEDRKFPIQLTSFKFTVHGKFDTFIEPIGVTNAILDKPGIIYALSYCNIHDLWENSIEIKIH
ncbi:desulfoferrodoxin family protein [Anaeromonas gelatinilytica]|uniref:desulfoferrodoxin family protein n=1 Tax=Anaeromonas gelatinilytica TaxID=2683194 RepID=UPI0033149838